MIVCWPPPSCPYRPRHNEILPAAGGFVYFRPETLTTKDLSSQTIAVIRLMNLLQDPSVRDRTIEEAFKCGPGLTYKLLRIVNSASFGGRGVQSIPHAMQLLGREPLYRRLCLLLMTNGSGGGEMRTEMVKAALVRARMAFHTQAA